MIFEPLHLPGAFLISTEPIFDERGFFARTWCRREAEEQGIEADMVQASRSFTRRTGSLRGLHFTWPPSGEGKLVRCVKGKVFDVVVDLRPSSSTFLSHHSVVLEEESGQALFVPPGVAHGFQTLEEDTEVFYMMSDFYRSELADGVRFDDPAFGIQWPMAVTTILDRDRSYPDFDVEKHRLRYEEALALSTLQDGVGEP